MKNAAETAAEQPCTRFYAFVKPQKKFAPDFFNDFSRAKPAPRSAHGSEALSYRKPSRTYFPAPSFRKTEQGAPPPGGLRTANSAQGGASDTVIPYADTALRRAAPGRARLPVCGGQTSRATPPASRQTLDLPAFTAWAFIAVEQTRRDRLFSRRRPFPRCRVHDALLSRSHASLAPRHISPAINRKKQQRCALSAADSPHPSALPPPAVSRKAFAPGPSVQRQRAERRFQAYRPCSDSRVKNARDAPRAAAEAGQAMLRTPHR